ncbi:hypothetical protein ACFV7R_45425 [Streptomyces sp. NPDC059866]|uniref:hypothetical protein n=1 Tax=Streptomyces sp. NPDC059866 TaxID=3346978 RepID=UPI00364BFE02
MIFVAAVLVDMTSQQGQDPVDALMPCGELARERVALGIDLGSAESFVLFTEAVRRCSPAPDHGQGAVTAHAPCGGDIAAMSPSRAITRRGVQAAPGSPTRHTGPCTAAMTGMLGAFSRGGGVARLKDVAIAPDCALVLLPGDS